MQETRTHAWDPWLVPALSLWAFFFAVGLFPERFFDNLRELGGVVQLRAMINSHWFVDFAWSGFVGIFTAARCREAGLGSGASTGKGVQVAVMGLTAFVPLRLENLPEYLAIPVPEYRYLILGTICAKGIAWLYLVQMILRYYLVSGHQVFVNMPSIFPSAKEEGGGPHAPQNTENQSDPNHSGMPGDDDPNA